MAAAAYRTGTKQTNRGGNFSSEETNSAVAAAAYRHGTVFRDERTGEVHDYRDKENVVWSGVLAPDNAPEWAHDRSRLWNAVEKVEKRKDAQLFRECLLTLPRELNLRQRIALVRAFVQDQFVDAGMVADIGLHNPDASDGLDQPHAHVMLTLRSIGSKDFGLKNRDWNDVQWENRTARKEGFLEKRRALWADYCNAALEEAGFGERVDHRSLKARGIDRQPQPKLGKARYAKPAPWIQGVQDKAVDVWAHNRSVEIGRARGEACLRDSHPRAAQIATQALMDDDARATARMIGHDPPPSAPSMGGRYVG